MLDTPTLPSYRTCQRAYRQLVGYPMNVATHGDPVMTFGYHGRGGAQ
ncbi:MAG: hypothetical protein ACRDQD_28610 [Nocardioidaceae bacterium]